MTIHTTANGPRPLPSLITRGDFFFELKFLSSPQEISRHIPLGFWPVILHPGNSRNVKIVYSQTRLKSFCTASFDQRDSSSTCFFWQERIPCTFSFIHVTIHKKNVPWSEIIHARAHNFCIFNHRKHSCYIWSRTTSRRTSYVQLIFTTRAVITISHSQSVQTARSKHTVLLREQD